MKLSAIASRPNGARGYDYLQSVSSAEMAAGFLLTTLSFKTLYANPAAVRILSFPDDSNIGSTRLQQRVNTVFRGGSDASDFPVPPSTFLSGKRQYTCRSFLLDFVDGASEEPAIGLLLERRRRDPMELFDTNRRFHLSPRERETVHHLVFGLTTKEIAQRMNVSPNTIKQYIRFVMTKMDVTTRSGIIGKILTC
jgi:DNA-binding CsgD family transcriptional regulator